MSNQRHPIQNQFLYYFARASSSNQKHNHRPPRSVKTPPPPLPRPERHTPPIDVTALALTIGTGGLTCATKGHTSSPRVRQNKRTARKNHRIRDLHRVSAHCSLLSAHVSSTISRLRKPPTERRSSYRGQAAAPRMPGPQGRDANYRRAQ